MRKKKAIILLSCIILLALAGAVVLILNIKQFYDQPERKGYERQKIEEEIASLFTEDLKKGNVETVTKTEAYYVNSDLEYEDENYEVIGGIKYTPDYAVGNLECVLEIPSIKLRRGVYTGTMAEIQHDLDIWMTTAAHPDYILGKTHYCIYGHNSPTQDLSFNNLKDVTVGDYFLLTSPTHVYVYDVTDFYAQWRELVTRDPICNFELPKEKCYIITCGRGQYRYRDIVVVGTLNAKYTIAEWENVKGEITAERRERHYTEKDTRERLSLTLEMKKAELVARLITPDGKPVSGADLCITDEDGLFYKTDGKEYRETDENGEIRYAVTDFAANTQYVLGGYDLKNEDYRDPDDVAFRIDLKKQERTIVTETVEEETYQTESYRAVWFVFTIISIVMILCILGLVIMAFRGPEKKGEKGD